ncbi:unnamed protein product [Phytophthora fragariaefolia]|uniref:Unnamed protein product n=1 Tax=Phytophthora fragariaefolia TaxID=1490495 RepID=A0A9W6U3Q9_9STRA|nr:unnamed protein product [Phytophthora fragariaefolia]
MNRRQPRHPWQLIAASMPSADASSLLDDIKSYRIKKSELWRCRVCMDPAPHAMRVQRMLCTSKACKDVAVATACPWRARVMTCQLRSLVTIEEVYNHLTPARKHCRPMLTPAMKDVVKKWAAQGLKPRRIWNAILESFSLTEATAPPLSSVQRFAHHHVAVKLGGSDVLDAVRKMVRDSAFTGEETTSFTFTSRSDGYDNAVTGN